MEQRAGKFINHDDKLRSHLFLGSLETTRKLFRVRFAQEYMVCHCWDCEAALSAISASKEVEKDRMDMSSITRGIRRDVAYHRAVELARRGGNDLPVRD